MRRAARLTAAAADTFSEFPISPTLFILSANFFKQYQEFFIAGRPEQRGSGDTHPPQVGAGGYELFQLVQDALVNHRIPNHARTTIGFGLLAEAYANFGFLGLAGLGVFFGFILKKAQCWAAESPMLSGGGLLIVILLAWSFQTEFTLSMWLASFYQASIAILVVPYVLRTFIQG